MDEQAQLKKNVLVGDIDVHPTEAALIVNYRLEATLLGEYGDPMLGQRKECQKIIRLKDVNNANISAKALANEVLTKCKLIPQHRVMEVEHLVSYLQRRHQNAPAKETSQLHSESLLSAVAADKTFKETALLSKLDEYMDLLYEDLPDKIRGSALILQLARNPDNLEHIVQSETLLGALARVLREDWKKSLDISTKQNEISNKDSLMKKYQILLQKQDSLLRICVYLLLNMAEDLSTEVKMVKRGIVEDLISVIDPDRSVKLIFMTVTFLRKLSVFRENKDKMIEQGLVKKLAGVFSESNSADLEMTEGILKLLTNLAFDQRLRAKMVHAGFLSRIVPLIENPAYEVPALSCLYLLSCEDKCKAMITYTDLIPMLMKIVLEQDEPSKEALALLVNVSLNKRAAELIAGPGGQGLRLLITKAFDINQIVLFKALRNIALQTSEEVKTLFVDFVGDFANVLNNSEFEDGVVIECLGILSALNLQTLDFGLVFSEYNLSEWVSIKLSDDSLEDDFLLEIVMFLGTVASEANGAKAILDIPQVIDKLVKMLSDRQDDDEIVAQIVYFFYQLLLHPDLRENLVNETQISAFLIDLMHDKNVEVRKICAATLDTIAEMNEGWAAKIREERFRTHNAHWLSMVMGESSGVPAHSEFGPDFYDMNNDLYEAEEILASQNRPVSRMEEYALSSSESDIMSS